MRRFVAVAAALVLVGAACAGAPSGKVAGTHEPSAVAAAATPTEPPPPPTPAPTVPPAEVVTSQVGPELSVTSPEYGATVTVAEVRFEGRTDPGCTVSAGTMSADVDAAGNWSMVLVLGEGDNVAELVATGPDGGSTTLRHAVSYVPFRGPVGGTWSRWGTTNFVEPNGIVVAGNDVWALTRGGLVRWDRLAGAPEHVSGSSWEQPDPRSLTVDGEGTVWVAFYDTVARLGPRPEVYSFPSQEEWQDPIQLATGPDGDVWAAAGHIGLHRFDGTTWTVVDRALPGREEVDALAVDGSGRVWIGTFWGGLWVRDGSDWRNAHPWPTPVISAAPNGDVWYSVRDMNDMSAQRATVWHVDGLSGEATPYQLGANSVWAIAPDGSGAWVGTSELWSDVPEGQSKGPVVRLWRLGGGEIVGVPGDWDDLHSQVLGVGVDDDGNVWLGGQRGVWRWDGTAARQYLTDSIGSFSVGYLEAMPGGGVWAGDCSRSAVRGEEAWDRLPDTPEEMWECAAAVGGDGTRWLASWLGLARVVDGAWDFITTDSAGVAFDALYPPCMSEACDEPAWTMTTTADGTVWAGMRGATDGLWGWSGVAWERMSIGGEAAGGVTAVAAGDDGSLWVATDNGIHRLRDGEWLHVPWTAPPTYDWPVTIGAGGDIVWVGTYGGLGRWDGSAWSFHERSEDTGVEVLRVDADGAVWLPHVRGAARFDGSALHILETPRPGEGWVQTIEVAADGSWWIVAGDTVYRWVP